jgi:hypothetical protein
MGAPFLARLLREKWGFCLKILRRDVACKVSRSIIGYPGYNVEERPFEGRVKRLWTRRASAPVVGITRRDPKRLQRYGFFLAGKYFFSIDATTT